MHSPALDNQAKQVFGNISNFHNNSLCHPSGYASSTGSFNLQMGQQIIMQNTWRFTVLHLWYELNWFIETSPKHDSIWASGNMIRLTRFSNTLFFKFFEQARTQPYNTMSPVLQMKQLQKEHSKETYKNTMETKTNKQTHLQKHHMSLRCLCMSKYQNVRLQQATL